MEDNIIELDNESYDRDREMEMDAPSEKEEDADLHNEIWAETVKEDIEQLQFAIDSNKHTIDTAIAQNTKYEIELEKKQALLTRDNNF